MENEQDILQRIAAKAVIVNVDGKVLILREASTYEDGNHEGKYQFPGGRVNVGESFEDALHREVLEETGLNVKLNKPLYVGEWRPIIKGRPNQIIAIFCTCETVSTKIKLSEEHDKSLWIDPKEYKKYNLVDPEPEVMKTFIAQ